MEIFVTFTFDASHALPNVPPGHKCGRMHGHRFQVEVHVDGPLDERLGWVIDFADLKALCDPIIEQLDHRDLGEIAGLQNPTSENIARWFWQTLKPELPILSAIIVRETPDAGAVYRGDEK